MARDVAPRGDIVATQDKSAALEVKTVTLEAVRVLKYAAAPKAR